MSQGNCLVIDALATDSQLQSARDALLCGARVVFESSLVLNACKHYLECHLVDTEGATHRCEREYEVLVENARRMLESSRFGSMLPEQPRRWLAAVTGPPR